MSRFICTGKNHVQHMSWSFTSQQTGPRGSEMRWHSGPILAAKRMTIGFAQPPSVSNHGGCHGDPQCRSLAVRIKVTIGPGNGTNWAHEQSPAGPRFVINTGRRTWSHQTTERQLSALICFPSWGSTCSTCGRNRSLKPVEPTAAISQPADKIKKIQSRDLGEKNKDFTPRRRYLSSPSGRRYSSPKIPRKIVFSLIETKHARSDYTVLKGGKATASSTVPYRANWFMDFNGLLSQIKNLMPPLSKQPTISENHICKIANKSKRPQWNTNDSEEST